MNEYRAGWLRYRAILDKIIAHPDYNYRAPYIKRNLLLKMADFAMQMMGHYNNQYHRNAK